MKSRNIKNLMKLTFTFVKWNGRETWTTTRWQISKLTSSIEITFLETNGRQNKTIDKIINKQYRQKLNLVPVKFTIQEGLLKWMDQLWSKQNIHKEKRQIQEIMEGESEKSVESREKWHERTYLELPSARSQFYYP